MVYKHFNKDNKLDSFTITCNCGCDDGMTVKVIDNRVYCSVISSSFSTEQGLFRNFYNYMDNIKKKICHKKDFLMDVIMTEEDIKDLLWCMENLVFDEGNDKQPVNPIKTGFYHEDGTRLYGLYFIYKGSWKDIIRNKRYRGNEVILIEKNWEKWSDYLKKFMDKSGL